MNTIFDTFKSVTRFDIQAYFDEFSSFVLSDYQKIVDFYSNGAAIPSDTINTLKDLNTQMLQINDLFNLYNDRLSSSTSEIWELLDYFESTKVTLMTIINSARWMRSTKNVLQSNVVNLDYILKQGETFEQLAGEVGYSDPVNDWSQLALNNDIKEEAYTFEGGNKLKISFVNDLSYDINSVIDSISGLKIYGLDIDCSAFGFDPAINDFKILGYKDTIKQQTTILLGLTKGSVPEFPQDGISKDLLGSNVNAIQYPVIMRQQSAVFEKDGRYKSIAIDSIATQVAALIMNITITTKLGEILSQNLVLQQ
jgi:hypothetical protein